MWSEVSGQRITVDGSFGGVSQAQFPNSVTFGRLLICAGSFEGFTVIPPDPTVTDDVGNTWFVVGGDVATFGNDNVRPFVCFAWANGNNQPTVSIDSGSGVRMVGFCLDEFDYDGSASFSVEAADSTGNDAAPTGGITTLTADELIIATAALTIGDGSITNDVGTQIGEIETGFNKWAVLFRIVGAIGGYTQSWTAWAGAPWSVKSVSFSDIVSPPSTQMPFITQLSAKRI